MKVVEVRPKPFINLPVVYFGPISLPRRFVFSSFFNTRLRILGRKVSLQVCGAYERIHNEIIFDKKEKKSRTYVESL